MSFKVFFIMLALSVILFIGAELFWKFWYIGPYEENFVLNYFEIGRVV